MRRGHLIGNIVWAVILSCIYVLGVTGCGGDSGPTPGSVAITTTSLPEGGRQPGLFGFTQRFRRRAPVHLVRLADASCQSLVGYGNRRNHRHADDGGNHDPHVYAARQLGPFPDRPTNARLNDSFGPGRAGNYHHFAP